MFEDLLEPVYGVDQSPPDDVHIVQVLLYFSEAEAEEFKTLCKETMKSVWPKDYTTKGNISDLLLTLLRNANIKTQAPSVG